MLLFTHRSRYIGKNKFTNEQLNCSYFFTYPDERDETNETYNEDETDETDKTDETDETDLIKGRGREDDADETDEADYETDNLNPSIIQRVDVLENQVQLLQNKFEKYALANYASKFNDNEVKDGNWVDG